MVDPTFDQAKVRDWFQKNRPKSKNYNQAVAAGAKKFGLSERSFSDIVRGLFPPKKPAIRKAGISRSAFLSTNDNDTRIREAARKVIASFDGDTILTDPEFRRLCGQHTTGWRDVTAEQEFSPYQFTFGGKTFWSDRETVKWALKEMPHKAKGI